jgi:acyl-CoA thioesterase FadM
VPTPQPWNYLKFLERARNEWLVALGFTLTVLESEHNAVFVVYRLEITLALVDRRNWRPMRPPAPLLARMEVVA